MAAAVWVCFQILYSVSLVHSMSVSAPVLCWLASVALELRSASGTSAGCWLEKQQDCIYLPFLKITREARTKSTLPSVPYGASIGIIVPSFPHRKARATWPPLANGQGIRYLQDKSSKRCLVLQFSLLHSQGTRRPGITAAQPYEEMAWASESWSD